ncbi:vWA domain-containing protein [Nicoliella lavandulae]|uniref:VWA-like domain-containing protein n=1 Tax=Nicoliella lavandulae TaxID=3082954 RepID=A0ABU8SL18_9LACO
MDLAQQLSKLQQAQLPSNQAVDATISAATIQLLRTHRFDGEVLIQLRHRYDDGFMGAIGLSWYDHQLVMLINPRRFQAADYTAEQLVATLRQLVLHLVFKHPLMYPKPNPLNRLACDLVVDQYLGADQTHQLAQVNFATGLNLLPDRGSHYYLAQLTGHFQNGNTTHHRPADQLAQLDQKLTGDSHAGWADFDDDEQSLQQGRLKQLMNRSWQNTPEKQRGELPGTITAIIQAQSTAPKIKNWRQLIRMGLGSIPLANKPSAARFNRRQAYRMELPGHIANTMRKINVFVDNSGSMGDAEINALLNEIKHFLSEIPTEITIYSFDAQVHFERRYRTNNAQQVKFERIGGGGTSYQAIFDYLSEHTNLLKDTLTVILTDGKGEKNINAHGINAVIWILTVPLLKFSLDDSFPGQVTTINPEVRGI